MFEGYAVVELPGGRLVDAHVMGFYEYDTGAFIDTEFDLFWDDSHEDLTDDEWNKLIPDDNAIDGFLYLHEWVREHGDFEWEPAVAESLVELEP